MEHTPAPKKGGSYFSVQLKDVHQKKKSGSCKKTIHSSTKFILFELEWPKTIKCLNAA